MIDHGVIIDVAEFGVYQVHALLAIVSCSQHVVTTLLGRVIMDSKGGACRTNICHYSSIVIDHLN